MSIVRGLKPEIRSQYDEAKQDAGDDENCCLFVGNLMSNKPCEEGLRERGISRKNWNWV